MAYTKPQVTIDLEEYNDLKERAKRNEGASGMALAKGIGFILLNVLEGLRGGGAGNYIRQLLIDQGIRVKFKDSTDRAMAEPDDVEITFTNQSHRR